MNNVKWTFIHGVNNWHTVWHPIVERMGLAEWSTPEVPAMADITDLALQFDIDYSSPYVLVGHSFGGMISSEIATKAGIKPAGIVIIASNLSADSPETQQKRKRLVEGAENGMYLEYALGNPGGVYHEKNVGDSSLMERRQTEVNLYGKDRFIAHQKAMAGKQDQVPSIAELNIPKLVIAGSHDRVVSPAKLQDTANSINAEFAVIPNTGHMLVAEEPTVLATTISSWAHQHGFS